MKGCEHAAGSAAYTAPIADSNATYDVAIVGAGIAGASLAYFLSARGMTNIVLLERESDPGYHSTGRSAATVCSFDFNPTLRRLKHMGASFLRQPPAGFADVPLLDPTGVLLLFAEPQWTQARALAAELIEAEGTRLELLSPQAAHERMNVLDARRFDGAVWVPDDGRIDVDALLRAYLRHANRAGVELRVDTEVTGVEVAGDRCVGVHTSSGLVRANLLINAAGAWAGRLGEMAGAQAIEFSPKRRTIVTFQTPEGASVSTWPLVCNETDELYFAPEAGGLLASPMDQQPSPPCDARPDELAVAHAVDKLERHAPALTPRSIRSKWAGLRTFAPDGNFVVGEDRQRRGFFWLAGQGGAGIETSPAVGRIAADLIATDTCDHFDTTAISPARFAPTT